MIRGKIDLLVWKQLSDDHDEEIGARPWHLNSQIVCFSWVCKQQQREKIYRKISLVELYFIVVFFSSRSIVWKQKSVWCVRIERKWREKIGKCTTMPPPPGENVRGRRGNEWEMESLEKWKSLLAKEATTTQTVDERGEEKNFSGISLRSFRAMTMNEFSFVENNIVQSEFYQENLWKIHSNSMKRRQ